MKYRSLVIIALVAAAVASCAPLRIVLNKTDKNGTHTVGTSDTPLFGSFELAMGMQTTAKKDTLVGLLITCEKDSDHSVFQKNDLLKIRFEDESEMALKNVYEKEFERETHTETTVDTYYNNRLAYAYNPWMDDFYVTPVTFRTFVPRTYTRTTSKSFALYLVTKQQLLDIMNKRIIKLRIEIESADCDMPFPEEFSSRVRELHDFVKDITPYKRKEF